MSLGGAAIPDFEGSFRTGSEYTPPSHSFAAVRSLSQNLTTSDPIHFTLTAPADPAFIRSDSFLLENSISKQSEPIACSISEGWTKLVCTPSEPLDVGTLFSLLTPTNSPLKLVGNHTLRLPEGVAISGSGLDLKGIKDVAGNVMPRVTSTFQLAGGSADVQGPILTSTNPASGASGVLPGQTLALQFNEGIAPHSVDSTSVQLFVLRDGVFSLVPFTANVVGSRVDIQAVPSLLPNSPYKVDVGRQSNGSAFGPADYAGNRTPTFEAFTFMTGAGAVDSTPPQVTSITPTDGAIRSEVLANNPGVQSRSPSRRLLTR